MPGWKTSEFICNICGAACSRPEAGLDRETPSCASCASPVRLRSLIALLSQELFGLQISLPDFPVLKSIRGIGMTDPHGLASLLAQKFDYTNTFYHQAPRFDITQPEERDLGRYDFILSSEVMEHVPPPVERAFSNLYRLLKPDGLLLLTTPFDPGGETTERFPDLHQYALTTLAGRTVLVNRRRDGSTEIFEDLMFHGGDGSTLEMRVFREESLLQMLREAGFTSVRVATENYPEWGVEHAQTWSLPILACKGQLAVSTRELAEAYRDARLQAAAEAANTAAIQADYARHVAHHEREHAAMVREMEQRTEWARRFERDLEDRTRWALKLEQEGNEARAAYERAQASEAAARKELEELREAHARLQLAFWTRLGRKLGRY